MSISQKCQYAVRAVLELAKHYGQGPLPISEIASKQAVPPRFLENILNEMKQGGFVDSRRGIQGGYLLLVDPRKLSVGKVIRFIDGPFDPVTCTGGQNKPCPLKGRCSLIELWHQAKTAVEKVYDSATFAQLAEREKEINASETADFCI
jgi:Rrf2 family transcriptional regulator, cysteine metabolism repressor